MLFAHVAVAVEFQWCCHKMWSLWRADYGAVQGRCYFESLVLMQRTTGWYLFSVMERLSPLLRSVRLVTGIRIAWYVFDRCCRDVLSRLAGRRPRSSFESISAKPEHVMASLLDWVLGRACVYHDAHNGLKKGMMHGEMLDERKRYDALF